MPDAAFQTGAEVRVRDLPAGGHVRTPSYVRGRRGRIERLQGRYPDPERRAYGADGLPPVPLYLVSFRQSDIWPGYRGPLPTVSCSTSSSIGWSPWRGLMGNDDPAHGHAHPVGRDHPTKPWERREAAIRSLLVEKGLLSAGEIRRKIEEWEQKSPALGARIVARAWSEPAFERRLLADANAAAAELGIEVRGVKLVALKNTPQRHHLVVCTLCSCYPRAVLGLPPAWYKAKAYRSRAVSDPRGVLEEFGTALAPEVEIRVVDSTADCRYLVVPMRPPGTESWEETRLAGLVNRDSMIGVAKVRGPAAQA